MSKLNLDISAFKVSCQLSSSSLGSFVNGQLGGPAGQSRAAGRGRGGCGGVAAASSSALTGLKEFHWNLNNGITYFQTEGLSSMTHDGLSCSPEGTQTILLAPSHAATCEKRHPTSSSFKQRLIHLHRFQQNMITVRVFT